MLDTATEEEPVDPDKVDMRASIPSVRVRESRAGSDQSPVGAAHARVAESLADLERSTDELHSRLAIVMGPDLGEVTQIGAEPQPERSPEATSLHNYADRIHTATGIIYAILRRLEI